MDSLVERARGGDRAAMEELLASVAPSIQRFGMRMCRASHDADDVLQDTLLAVAQHLIVADAIPPPLGGTRNPDLPGPACDGLRRPRKALNGVDGVSNDLMAPLGRAAHPVAAQAALYYGGSQVRRKCDSSKIQRRIFTILF